MKDRTKFEHRQNIVYFCRCPNITYHERYMGQADRKIKECIMDHNKKEKSSHLPKHARESHPLMVR